MQGEQVLDMVADDFGPLMEGREEPDKEEEFDRVMANALFKEILVDNRAAIETYQDETRVFYLSFLQN